MISTNPRRNLLVVRIKRRHQGCFSVLFPCQDGLVATIVLFGACRREPVGFGCGSIDRDFQTVRADFCLVPLHPRPFIEAAMSTSESQAQLRCRPQHAGILGEQRANVGAQKGGEMERIKRAQWNLQMQFAQKVRCILNQHII